MVIVVKMEEAWGRETRPQVCFNNGERFVPSALGEMPKNSVAKNTHWVKPKSIIRLLRANKTIFLSPVSLLFGYNGTFSLSQKSKDMFT